MSGERPRVSVAKALDAIDRVAARLTFETDVAAALSAGTAGLGAVDSRGQESWDQGIEDTVHLPTACAPGLIPPGVSVVTYRWGPGCNGATRAALEFARLGYRVKEMIGGFEYRTREGFPVVTATGPARRPVDPLTAPTSGIARAGEKLAPPSETRRSGAWENIPLSTPVNQ